MSTLRHTPRDIRVWDRIVGAYTSLTAAATELCYTNPDAFDMARDLFWLFYQIEPTRDVSATDSYADVIDAVMYHPLYSATRAAIGDMTIYSIATVELLLRSFAVMPRDVAVGNTLQNVRSVLDEMRKRMETFGTMTGYQPMPLEQQLSVANTLGSNPKIAKLAQIAGRLKKLAVKVQATRTPRKRDQVRGVTYGRDVRSALPAELGLLAATQTAPLFAKRYADNLVAQRERDGREETGQGPIIVVIDSSGSMTYGMNNEHPSTNPEYTRELWSKAVALALVDIAKVQKRDVAIIHFGSGARQIKTWHFSAGNVPADELAACCAFFYGGWTTFDDWMRESLKLVESSKYDKADVIVLSDGGAHISPEVEDAWRAAREQRGMRCYGVLIGVESPGGLALAADQIVMMSGMADEEAATNMMFGI